MVKIGVTGATGVLGGLAIKGLVSRLGPDSIIALARHPDRAAGLGVSVRACDYDQPETLPAALQGVEKLLFISSPTLGSRIRQHTAMLEAAKAAGVQHLVYTSMLHADSSTVEPIAEEDCHAEALLKQSGIPFTILRNGFYTENHMQALADALAAGAFIGCAGPSATFSCAPRSDYAAAAVAVLTSEAATYEGRTLNLAGDPEAAYTLPEMAAEVSKQTGKPFAYQEVPLEEYVKVLASAGIPEIFARAYALFDVDAEAGGLFHDGHELSELLGRPTVPLAEVLRAWLPSTPASA